MIKIVDVNATNVEETGFFCMKSKPQSAGYQRKLQWLKQRFAEGLKLKILEADGRQAGFIEYAPIEQTWRTVLGENYLVIHCLWVRGGNKGKGYGSKLLDTCMRDAREQHKSGVAVVTGKSIWLAKKEFFMKHGFELADEAPPSFELMVKKFDDSPVPRFPGNWAERTARCGKGFTVFRSDQCPFIDGAVQVVADTAKELDMDIRIVDLDSSRDVQNCPTVFGVFAVLLDGELLTYHPVTKRELLKLLRNKMPHLDEGIG